MTIEERVAQGVAWLDAHGPENWWRAVDLDRLDTLSIKDNILGMVYRFARDATLLEDGEAQEEEEEEEEELQDVPALQWWLARATDYGFRVTVRGENVDWITSNDAEWDATRDAKQEASQLKAAWVEIIVGRNRREKIVHKMMHLFDK